MTLLQQRPAKYRISGNVAEITFTVHLEDLDKYYKNGFIFVEKKDD